MENFRVASDFSVELKMPEKIRTVVCRPRWGKAFELAAHRCPVNSMLELMEYTVEDESK